MDYFPRKSLSKYLTDTIDFNKHVHNIDIFINDKWGENTHTATLQNYKATWTSLMTNEKVKSTFTRRLLCPNRPPTWALPPPPLRMGHHLLRLSLSLHVKDNLQQFLSGVLVTRSLILCVMFCRSLFCPFVFFFWPLCCLSFFDLQILQTLLNKQ